MIPFQFNIDILDELEKALPSYKLITPAFVVNELEGLKKSAKGKDRVLAGLALKLTTMDNIEIKDIHRKEGEPADDALLRVSKILATNDLELRRRARKKGIKVVYLRQKRYVEVDGYLDY